MASFFTEKHGRFSPLIKGTEGTIDRRVKSVLT